jgi:predicted metal-dependent HD superfamily phosphohydrolase
MNHPLEITAADIRDARIMYADLPYHNFLHAIGVMMEVWELAREAALDVDIAIVNQAALWHDVIYVPGAKDNEERSAQFAYVATVDRDRSGAAEVARLIRLTKNHLPGPLDLAGALICDADLAGFAKPFTEFSINNERIAEEFDRAGLGAAFDKGRAEFLRTMKGRADAECLFNFPVRLEERNATASDNIAKALLNLEVHGD